MKSLSLKVITSIIIILIFIKITYSFNVEYKRGLHFDHTIGNVIIVVIGFLIFFTLFKWFKK